MTEFREVTTQAELAKALAAVTLDQYGTPNIVPVIKGNGYFRAYGSASVEAYGSASVRAYGSASVEAFLDMVEQVSPEPRCEMFARRDRLGWDTWGNEALGTAAMPDPAPLNQPSETVTDSTSSLTAGDEAA